jgi:hypothetical protein
MSSLKSGARYVEGDALEILALCIEYAWNDSRTVQFLIGAQLHLSGTGKID